MNIQEKIISIIKEQFNNDVKLDSELIQDLQIDELDILELVMAIEDEFKIGILDEDSESWKTVKDIVEYIKGKMK